MTNTFKNGASVASLSKTVLLFVAFLFSQDTRPCDSIPVAEDTTLLDAVKQGSAELGGESFRQIRKIGYGTTHQQNHGQSQAYGAVINALLGSYGGQNGGYSTGTTHNYHRGHGLGPCIKVVTVSPFVFNSNVPSTVPTTEVLGITATGVPRPAFTASDIRTSELIIANSPSAILVQTEIIAQAIADLAAGEITQAEADATVANAQELIAFLRLGSTNVQLLLDAQTRRLTALAAIQAATGQINFGEVAQKGNAITEAGALGDLLAALLGHPSLITVSDSKILNNVGKGLATNAQVLSAGASIQNPKFTSNPGPIRVLVGPIPPNILTDVANFVATAPRMIAVQTTLIVDAELDVAAGVITAAEAAAVRSNAESFIEIIQLVQSSAQRTLDVQAEMTAATTATATATTSQATAATANGQVQVQTAQHNVGLLGGLLKPVLGSLNLKGLAGRARGDEQEPEQHLAIGASQNENDLVKQIQHLVNLNAQLELMIRQVQQLQQSLPPQQCQPSQQNPAYHSNNFPPQQYAQQRTLQSPLYTGFQQYPRNNGNTPKQQVSY